MMEIIFDKNHSTIEFLPDNTGCFLRMFPINNFESGFLGLQRVTSSYHVRRGEWHSTSYDTDKFPYLRKIYFLSNK